ncbi:MAG: hypothetical protein HGB12_09320 [Bacteroidetes bacterium]|nr:hypothetical protein [Bacteroidota bacterium]
MRKFFITSAILIFGIGIVVAQNNNTSGNQGNQNNNQPQKTIQPDMNKDTVVFFQGRYGGPIKSADILKEDSLTMNKVGFQIVGFTLVFRKDTTLNKYDSKNNKLSSEMKTALKDLKPGQNFSFVNIRIMAKGGKALKPTYDKIDMFIEREKQ